MCVCVYCMWCMCTSVQDISYNCNQLYTCCEMMYYQGIFLVPLIPGRHHVSRVWAIYNIYTSGIEYISFCDVFRVKLKQLHTEKKQTNVCRTSLHCPAPRRPPPDARDRGHEIIYCWESNVCQLKIRHVYEKNQGNLTNGNACQYIVHDVFFSWPCFSPFPSLRLPLWCVWQHFSGAAVFHSPLGHLLNILSDIGHLDSIQQSAAPIRVFVVWSPSQAPTSTFFTVIPGDFPQLLRGAQPRLRCTFLASIFRTSGFVRLLRHGWIGCHHLFVSFQQVWVGSTLQEVWIILKV